MARTPAQAKALEAKALKEENKSEGMRMLLTEGYSVQEVRDVFGAPYGFVYGVAKRAGLVEAAATRRTPAAPKAETKVKTAAPAKAKAAPAKASKTAAVAEKVAPRRTAGRPATRKAGAKAKA